jgi:hypothetical protein
VRKNRGVDIFQVHSKLIPGNPAFPVTTDARGMDDKDKPDDHDEARHYCADQTLLRSPTVLSDKVSATAQTIVQSMQPEHSAKTGYIHKAPFPHRNGSTRCRPMFLPYATSERYLLIQVKKLCCFFLLYTQETCFYVHQSAGES